MPSFRKLGSAETAALEQPALGARARVAQEYDQHLADFAVGDYGRAEPIEGEQRKVVRSRLHAAARRRGLALRFRPGPSAALIFHVEAAPAPAPSPTPPHQPVGSTRVAAQRDDTARRDPAPARPPSRRESSTERYREVLPRWMREGQPPVRRDGSKRRTR
jgi:hypothetical protein